MLTEAIKEDFSRVAELTDDFSFVRLAPYEGDIENRRDIAIYWIAVALTHIFQWILKQERSKT